MKRCDEAPLLSRHFSPQGRSEWRFQEAAASSVTTDDDPTASGIEVRSSGNGKGLGVFALRQFTPGDRIFSEAPLLQWTSDDEVQYPRVSHAWLKRQLELSPPATQAAFEALCASPAHADKGPALARWITNAYPGESDGDGAENDSAAVYRIGSRFNHDCLASCATSWNGRLRKMTFHAVRSIAPGEEITVNYLGQAGHTQSRDARQAELRKLGFQCHCALCTLSTAGRVASDARRSQMASLRAQLSQERDLGSEGASYEHCESLLETLLSLMRVICTRAIRGGAGLTRPAGRHAARRGP